MQENEKQRAYWNGPAGQAWADHVDAFELGFTDITAAAMTFAALEPGLNVLDIGCGAGTTTAAIAAAVAPGKAVGIDISAPLIAAAKARGGAATFIEADASDYPFKPEFDLVLSRFGVQFFADPMASFANIRKALKSGGRLAFITWCPFEEVTSAYAAFAAVRDLLPPQNPISLDVPGPYSLSDAARTKSLLEKAGFKRVRMEKTEPLSLLGKTLDAAVNQAMNLGPLALAVRDLDEAAKNKLRERIRPVLEPYRTQDGIAVPAACWLVEAYA